MSVILDTDTDWQDSEGYSEFSNEFNVANLAIDNWLDSGYRLVLPEREYWSDNYQGGGTYEHF